MKVRRIIFWMHLGAGVSAGVIIFVMCVTGVALAFEKEIVAWAEGDARRISTSEPRSAAVPLDTLVAKGSELYPDLRPSGVTVYADPAMAVLVAFGRTNSCYVNPYTGAAQPQGATALRRFMRVMIDWHRYLGREGAHRATGKAITGACIFAFLTLAVSGLYLWWPRQWSRPNLRAITLFDFSLRRKARDWNWHNVFGLWSAPVLIVLTATAMPISYRWAGDLIYRLTGTAPPNTAPEATIGAIASPPEAVALNSDQLLAAAKQHIPQWKYMTLRLGGPPRSNAGTNTTNSPPSGPANEARTSRRAAQPATVTVRLAGAWPRTSTTTLTLDPFTGALLRGEGFSDFNLGRQIRTWTRFLHTGEALGWGGQFVAGLASFGGAMLVWTGLALACRRFFFRQEKTSVASIPPVATKGPEL